MTRGAAGRVVNIASPMMRVGCAAFLAVAGDCRQRCPAVCALCDQRDRCRAIQDCKIAASRYIWFLKATRPEHKPGTGDPKPAHRERPCRQAAMRMIAPLQTLANFGPWHDKCHTIIDRPAVERYAARTRLTSARKYTHPETHAALHDAHHYAYRKSVTTTSRFDASA